MSKTEQKCRSDAVKKLIIEATIEIIKQKGFEAVSIRNIAKRIGYSTGVIYYHFKNKNDIISTIHDEANKNVMRIIENTPSGDKGTIDNIKSVFFEVMKVAVNDKDFFDLIIIDKYSVRKESINPWIIMIEDELYRGIENSEIRVLDVKQTAFCIWSAYLGFYYMLGKVDGIDIERAKELFESMSQLITTGIEILNS